MRQTPPHPWPMEALPMAPARARPVGLCVLCGLPAAGKSSLARALGRGAAWDCARISYDDVIPAEAFLPQLEMSCWKQHRRQLLIYVEHFLLALKNGSSLCAPTQRIPNTWQRFVNTLTEQGLVSSESAGTEPRHRLLNPTARRPLYVVLDDNFYYQSMRYEVYQLARKYSLGFCQLFVDCSLETCLQRNRRRDPPLPDGTILLMAEKIQVPNPEKNPWEKNSIMLRNGEDNPEVEDLLCMALENPVREFQENTAAEKDADRAVCAASLLHQADQALRKIISETMRMAKENVPAKGMKTLAEELGKLKCQSLDDLRHGRFLDPASEHHGSDVQDTVARFLQKTDGLLQEYIGSPQ